MSSRALKYRTKRGSKLAADTPPPGAKDPAALDAKNAINGEPHEDKSTEAINRGDDNKSEAVTDAQTLDAIKKEGLTGRQLRMARRIAQKNGLAPTSDFDAVRLLRAKGIDPFERSNVLQITERAPDAQVPALEAKPRLPQTQKEAPVPGPLAPPPQPPDPAEQRASDILKIQRNIAKRRQRKLLLLVTRLSFFVFLPTLLAGWYYFFVATPLYATHSEFTIQQADSQSASGLGGLFQGTGLAVQQDSTTVQSYLQSRDAMLRLDTDLGFREHWSQSEIDEVQRLAPDASNEDLYALYSSKVKIGYDPTEGILKMEVIAADPTSSQAFSERLIGYAEEQVDNLTQRLRNDQMKGSLESYADAEENVSEAQARVLELQERMGVLDPVSETSSLMGQITQFETQLRVKQLELDQLLANARPSPAKVRGVQGEIARLEALVADLRASMTEGANGAASLARITGELRIAEADLTTRQLLLQQAASQMETARIEANRQTRYVTVGVSPVAPDEPTYPRAAENTALAFAIFAGIYLMLSLTASVLREQVSA